MKRENKERMNDLYKLHTKKNHPNYPEKYIGVYRISDNSTNGLTRCVIDFLTFNGWQAERISSTGRYIDKRKKVTDVVGRTAVIGSGEWIPGTGTKGTADISATINGRSVKIEIKFEKDRQSDAQKRYEDSIVSAGGVYLIVRNFDDFLEWYNLFIIRVKYF